MLANLNDVLLPAKEKGYGVGLFNTPSLEFARGVIEAAEEMQAPVIIGTAEIFLHLMSLETTAEMLLPLADRASVPVVVHLDHGLTEATCLRAMELGFTSIMYDCSVYPYDVNIQRVAEMAAKAHARGITIEGELGHVADNEGKGAVDDPTAYYTLPEEALDYVTKTNIDCLAVAVGTAHGAYKFPPKLDFDRIRTISEITGIPLVLHGGSGLTDDDFRHAIREGIQKINIFTDINDAGARAAYDGYASGKTLLTDLQPLMVDAIRKETIKKMKVFMS